jgi:hypothetical protein
MTLLIEQRPQIELGEGETQPFIEPETAMAQHRNRANSCDPNCDERDRFETVADILTNGEPQR